MLTEDRLPAIFYLGPSIIKHPQGNECVESRKQRPTRELVRDEVCVCVFDIIVLLHEKI